MSPRHWWQALAALLLLLAAIGATVWSMRDQLSALSQPVTHIYVTGQLHYLSDAAVVDALRPLMGQRFFDLDVVPAREKLLALPWVRQAVVRKRWPDGLSLYLSERTPLARWGVDGLVDASGHVFTPAKLGPALQALPLLGAPNPALAKLVLKKYASWGKQLAGVNSHISRLVRDARGSWQLQLDSGLTVLLGREQADARLARYLRVTIPALGAKLAQAQRIDLRYRDGFAVAWRDESRDADDKSANG